MSAVLSIVKELIFDRIETEFGHPTHIPIWENEL